MRATGPNLNATAHPSALLQLCAGLLALVGASTSCVLPNPAFDEPSGSDSSTRTSTSASASAADDTGATSPAGTTSSPTSTSTSTGGAGSTAAPTATATGPASTSESTSTSGSTSTTGAGWLCDLSPGAWAIAEPELVEAINTPSLELDASLLADGRTLYFSSDRPNGAGGFDTYVTARTSDDEPFGPPLPVGDPGWNQTSNEGGLTLRGDGLEVFLARDVSGDFRLWTSTRASTDVPFVRWQVLPGMRDAHDPHLSDDGLKLYGAAGPLPDLDLFVLSRDGLESPWGLPEFPASVNTASYEASPSVSADERVLVFTRNVGGQFDLFVAYRPEPDQPFDVAAALDDVNTGAHEAESFLAEFEGSCELYFSSDRSGDWAIYRAPIVQG